MNNRLLADCKEASDEAGKITVIAMLICLASIIGYLKVGRFVLPEALTAQQHTVLLLIIFTTTLFTIGCVLHVIFLGEKSPRQLRKELKKQLKFLQEFLVRSKDRIEAVENQVSYRTGLLRPAAYDNLSNLRQIMSALERRTKEVDFLLATKRKPMLYRAAELIGADLRSVENCFEQLIDSKPLPAITSDNWIPTVEHLLAALEDESRRARSLRAA